MLAELRLKVAIGFFYLLGLVVRKLFPDPLAGFFAEMERSGRLKIKAAPKASSSGTECAPARVTEL